MAYTLTLKVLSATVPEGDYYVTVAKNKADKKEKHFSQTPVSKKVAQPSWTHSVEMPAAPTDEILFELYRGKKLYATASLVVGLVDSGRNNDVRMTYTAASGVSHDAKACNLTFWGQFVKAGSVATAQAEPSAAPKKESLRTARAGTPGSSSRPVLTAESSSPGSGKKDKEKEKEKEKEKDKKVAKEKKAKKPSKKEESDSEPEEKAEKSESEEEEYVAKPPRRKPQPKTAVVPEDEDPVDFWNGTSKSKTKQKKKEIKKLQQSLESMTINLKSSWNANSAANDQQRFAVMIHEIGLINLAPDSCAGHEKVDNTLTLRLAFAIDMAEDKASGCGIDTAKWLFVEMRFPGGIYLQEPPNPSAKTLLIRQCPPMSSSDEIRRFHDPSSLGLWWTLEQRLAEQLRKDWNTLEANANKSAKTASKDASSVGTADAWAILQILEWPSSELPIASKALEEVKNDVKMALELILDEAWLEKTKEALGEGKSKKSDSSKKSFDSQFLQYIIDSIKKIINDAGKYCPICAEPHPLEFFKPIVCSKDLCKFQFSNMGLGVDFESELLHSPNEVDLLIHLTAHAVQGTHFDPFPSEVSTKIDGITHGFKTANDISQCLMKCPSVDSMIEHAKAGKLRQVLNDEHPLLYLLLRWIVTSSRAHLQFLTPADHVPQITTLYQFHLKSTPPEKEQKFYAAKKKHGSFYAWHGSATSNWHSILRNGLKNYSGSKHQVNGAAYGAGVYMAVDSATSLGYSYRSSGSCWPHSRYYDGDLLVLALCEVINEGELICTGNVHRPHCLHCPSAPFYRIEKDEYIITRYLFVLPNHGMHVLAADIQSQLKSKQLLRSNKAVKTKKVKDHEEEDAKP